MSEKAMLKLTGLHRHFPVAKHTFFEKRKYLKAVNGVDLTVARGETLGLVGESGCGKSTLGLVAMKLLQPSAGRVIFDGVDITDFKPAQMRPMRRDMQIIFQDPYASLDPRMTVGDIISEPLRMQKAMSTPKELLMRILELMDECGLDRAFLNRYPHEFSGGQRQRIGIARALALNPKFMVCDEPVSALDVSIQSQIINLLQQLREKYALTMIFISHDLAVIHHISDRVAVMYLGKVVELGSREQIFSNPLHPYTLALLSSVPKVGQKAEKRFVLEGELPSPVNPPVHCTFLKRCPKASEECKGPAPSLVQWEDGHSVACFKAGGGL